MRVRVAPGSNAACAAAPVSFPGSPLARKGTGCASADSAKSAPERAAASTMAAREHERPCRYFNAPMCGWTSDCDTGIPARRMHMTRAPGLRGKTSFQLRVHRVDRTAPARLHRHAAFGDLVDVDVRVEGEHAAALSRAHRGADVASGAAGEHELLHRPIALEDEHLVHALLADAGARSRPHALHVGRFPGLVVEQHSRPLLSDEQ